MRRLFQYISIQEDEIVHFKKWMLIGLGIHLICAYFSTGFFHFDEHWQILEFLGAKIGKTTFDVLPWEYQYRMRSWTQPFIYFILFKPFLYLGVDDPFKLALIARVFSSLVGWLSIVVLSVSVFFLFEKILERKWGIILLNVSYFIPFIHARPSSEAFASSFFCMALGLIVVVSYLAKQNIKVTHSWLLVVGFLAGLSFTFRFQMGFVILFLWIWYAVWGKGCLIKNILMILGILFAIVVEIFIDRWGYGEWTVVAWNYLNQNIVLDKASNFPTGPWYYFFTKSLTRIALPISLLVVPAWLIFWFKRYKHPMTFGTLPLVIIHSIIANKAFRYLIPIAPLSPIILIEVSRILPQKYIQKSLWFFKLCLVINCVLLLYVMFSSAKPVVGMYQYVYHKKITQIHYTGESPYSMVGLPLNFYKSTDLEMKFHNSYEELNNKSGWIFIGKGEKIIPFLKRPNCSLEYSSYPSVALNYNYFRWIEKSRFWALFLCE